MAALINYLMESSLILGVLTIFYRLFLHHESMFRFNRIYLISSLLLSAIIPFVDLLSFFSNESQQNAFVVMLNDVDVYAHQVRELIVPVILKFKPFTWLYIIGSLFLFTRLVWGFSRLGGFFKHANWTNYKGFKVAYLPGHFNPFSFFRVIFVNPKLYSNDDLDKIMEHEMAHIQLKHSFDVIFVELLLIMQWFNPFAWIIRVLLKELHEFQADKEVIKKGTSLGQYKMLLLCQAAGTRLLPVNNFSQSITKRRFKMMSNNLENKKSYFKMMISLVLLISVAFVFSCESFEDSMDDGIKTITKNGKVYNQMLIKNADGTVDTVLTLQNGDVEEDNLKFDSDKSLDGKPVFFIVEQMPKYPGGEEELRKFIAQNIRYPKEAQESAIQGRVYVEFIVDFEGSVRNATVVRGVDKSVDDEALRVINSMPKWIPATQRGEAVNVRYTIPINFKLQ